MKRSKKRIAARYAVVATAHTLRGLRLAAALRPGRGIDLVEVRVDALDLPEARLRAAVGKIRLPVIVTVRHPREGGLRVISNQRRAALYENLLGEAAFVDVELRSVQFLREVLARAAAKKVGIILSFHDFSATPSVARLAAKAREGMRHGADIVKIATKLSTPRDLAVLMELQGKIARTAVMGMGAWGKVSRLVLPLVGARLVYGYLDRPQVDGQWSAGELAARLREVAA